jgi:hypothetical protein
MLGWQWPVFAVLAADDASTDDAYDLVSELLYANLTHSIL